MPRHVIDRHLRDAALLPWRHGLGATAECRTLARLHFDEHRHIIMPRNDVDFAESRAIAPINNFVPLATQLRAREILPENSQCLPTIAAHARRRSTIHAIALGGRTSGARLRCARSSKRMTTQHARFAPADRLGSGGPSGPPAHSR